MFIGACLTGSVEGVNILAEPSWLVAITSAITYLPASAWARLYVELVWPEIVVHPLEARVESETGSSQRSQR